MVSKMVYTGEILCALEECVCSININRSRWLAVSSTFSLIFLAACSIKYRVLESPTIFENLLRSPFSSQFFLHIF